MGLLSCFGGCSASQVGEWGHARGHGHPDRFNLNIAENFFRLVSDFEGIAHSCKEPWVLNLVLLFTSKQLNQLAYIKYVLDLLTNLADTGHLVVKLT